MKPKQRSRGSKSLDRTGDSDFSVRFSCFASRKMNAINLEQSGKGRRGAGVSTSGKGAKGG